MKRFLKTLIAVLLAVLIIPQTLAMAATTADSPSEKNMDSTVIIEEEPPVESEKPEPEQEESAPVLSEELAAIQEQLPDGLEIPIEPKIEWTESNLLSCPERLASHLAVLNAISEDGSKLVTKVYDYGVLIEQNILDKSTMVMYTELYSDNLLLEHTDFQVTVEDDNGICYITRYLPTVSEKLSYDIFCKASEVCDLDYSLELESENDSNYAIPINEAHKSSPAQDSQFTSLKTSYNEAFLDTKYSNANYGDGYYKVSTHSGYSYAPGKSAVITRKCATPVSLGATKSWSFSAGKSFGAISTALVNSIGTGPAGFLLELLVFTATEILAYDQAVSYDTYRYTYNYRVRIPEAGKGVYFTTQRVFDFWHFYNSATGKAMREESQFVGGFSLENSEMAKQAISNYLDYHFYDIINHWGKESIRWAYNKGYLNGTSDYAFSPNGTTTRSMAITVLYRMEGQPSASTSTPFTDVPASAFYAKAVSWGVKNGIVSGKTSTQFAPNEAITLEQFACMLYKYAKYKGKNMTASGNLSKFADGSTVSSWAKTAMQWAVGKNIIIGNDDGYLHPKNTASRAQLCTLIQRFSNVR